MSDENNSENPFSTIPTVPTIEVRTLHGDVDSMTARGGTAMQVEDVTEMIGRKSPPVSSTSTSGGGNLLFRMIVLVLTILIAALIVGLIFKANLISQVPFLNSMFTSGSSTVATSTPIPAYVPSVATENFDPYADIESQRFFRIDPDAEFTMLLSRQAAQTTEDLLTFSQKVSNEVSKVPASAKLIEIELIKDGGKPADILTFSSLSGISLFPEQFMKDNFEPNMTGFIFRNVQGVWPGYIFKLLPNKNPRLLTSQVQLLERSPQTTAGLFLTTPGVPRGGFTDGTRSGVSTREQVYEKPGAAIAYAWQDRYFVISTSLEGLAETLRRLAG